MFSKIEKASFVVQHFIAAAALVFVLSVVLFGGR
jgi:hypothetical protein